ncbi:DUF3305 domain-containing protein [Ferrimonas balearica]|uniref:DUF3305 domain-containing protein n=1 Tax=Ferrimonas balearica TaxID=44012 RepID=UPI001C99B705|nr:DUF3305 domain-containing protein [Ferrimonas balearica]MBY5993251.1 DUF3305 domain-containing protein [Ferrimonas balearica]
MQHSESIWPLYVTLASKEVQVGRWTQTNWEVASLLPATGKAPEGAHLVALELYLDERANYRLNLDLDHPKLFVICDDKGDGVPVPMSVTANQNVAAGALEGDTPVLTCAIPEAIGCWIESFITRHGEAPIQAHRRRHIDVRGEARKSREES